MKRGAIWLTVAFMLATASLSCSGGKDAEIARLEAELRSAKQEVARAADTEREKTRPKVWLDKDAAESIRLLGYDNVFVIRWQHGEVEGWYEIDEEEGPKQYTLDSMQQMPPPKGEKREAKDVSGTIVVALRRVRKSDGPQTATDTFHLQMGIHGQLKDHGTSAIGIGKTSPLKVKMDPNPNSVKVPNATALGDPFGGYDDNDLNLIVLKRFIGQKESPWLKLKFVEK